MSNISQKIYKFESLNKLNKSKQKKKTSNENNKPNKLKPLPEWNTCINDPNRYKLTSSDIVK